MMDRNRTLAVLKIFSALLMALSVEEAFAERPVVKFDVPAVVSCRDVTTEEFAEMNPGEKLIEANIRVSSLIRSHSKIKIKELFYLFENRQKGFRIVDYYPQTNLATDVVGNISIDTRQEKSSSVGLTLSGRYDSLVTGSADGASGLKNSKNRKYELSPPLELISAGGTTRRGSGVYFKLNPSSRTSLEGAKDFQLVMRVSRTWRGDYLEVSAQATSLHPGVVSTLDEEVVGSLDFFVVGLHAAGDQEAKSRAEELLHSELELRSLATQYRKDLESGAFPTVAHRLGALFSVVTPKIPATWLSQLIHRPADGKIGPFGRHLPKKVRDSAEHYAQAKQNLHLLNGREELALQEAKR